MDRTAGSGRERPRVTGDRGPTSNHKRGRKQSTSLSERLTKRLSVGPVSFLPREGAMNDEHALQMGGHAMEEFAFWKAVVETSDECSEVYIIDPRFDEDAIKEAMVEEYAEKVDSWWELIENVESGDLRDVCQAMRATSRQGFPSGHLLARGPSYDPQRTSINQFFTQYRFETRGRCRFLLANRIENGREWHIENKIEDAGLQGDPEDVAKLYDDHKSNDIARRMLIAATENIDQPLDFLRPRTLKQLGRLPNAELRRAVKEFYGARVLTEEPLQRDDYGDLYRVDDDTKAVHVVDPSTGRDYFLGVPGEVETAREAVLWSFGFTGEPEDDSNWETVDVTSIGDRQTATLEARTDGIDPDDLDLIAEA